MILRNIRTIALTLVVSTVLAASWALSTAPAQAAKGSLAPDLETTRAAIQEILGKDERLPGHLQRVREVLTDYYVTGQGPVLWVGTSRMSPLMQRLEFADEDGLKREDYPVDYLIGLRDVISPNDPASSAFAELTFSAYFLRYASDLKIGRFVPRKIDPKLFQTRPKIDLVKVLTRVKEYADPNQYLRTEIEPQNVQYRSLKPMLRRYRAVAQNGGWQKVPNGETLKPGMSDPRVPAIRARLVASGDLASGTAAEPELYDDALALAVQQYQRRHGLNDEGIVGKLTLTQMNIPVEERVRQIIVNMERWRWMPEDMGDKHIMVNIAAFELQRIVSGLTVERKRVVVGKTYHQTPVFSEDMKYLELNPTWNVPYSIATKEMLPKLKRNPNALGSSYELLSGGQVISFSSVDFNQYSRGNFPYRIRQKAGDKNALGQVKFMLPNKHAVYLHDTPSRNLFARDARAFSHGCVRVHEPVDLAETILRQVPGWDRARIDAVLASRKNTRVNLVEHIPVHIVYATAFQGEGGTVEFRPDIYGRDKKLYRALFALPTS